MLSKMFIYINWQICESLMSSLRIIIVNTLNEQTVLYQTHCYNQCDKQMTETELSACTICVSWSIP